MRIEWYVFEVCVLISLFYLLTTLMFLQEYYIRTFFFVLSRHPTLRHLAVDIDDPERPGRKTKKFIVDIRGVKTPAKTEVITASLIAFSQLFVKKDYLSDEYDLTKPEVFAAAQYQPNVVNMSMKTLFSYFSKNDIWYRLMKDFNSKGSLLAYWRYAFEMAKKYQIDYGTLPNAAEFDPEWREKRAIAIKKGALDPLNNYEHHTWCLVEEVMTCNGLRGEKEVRKYCVLFLFLFLLINFFKAI